MAVVTGASSGIGLEFVTLLAEEGYDLVLAARSRSEMERIGVEMQRRHGIRVRIVPGDLSDPANVDRIIEAIQGQPVDVLINSAGFGSYGVFEQIDWDLEYDMILLNVAAVTQLCKRLLPAMVHRRYGRVLNVASMAAFLPGGPYMAVYYATKAYVLSFSQALSSELADTGVTITALCPGPTASGFSRASGAEHSKVFSRPLPSAASVASFGYQAMKEGKTIAIPGWQNKLIALLTPILPRTKVLDYVKKRQSLQR